MRTFLAGLGVGVVGGFLLAPKRGQQTRAALRDRVKRIFGSASAPPVGRTSSVRKSASKPVQSTVPAENKRESAAEILNTASREELMAVHGIGQVLAQRIIDNRPYQTAYEVVERGLLPESAFVQLRRELLERGA